MKINICTTDIARYCTGTRLKPNSAPTPFSHTASAENTSAPMKTPKKYLFLKIFDGFNVEYVDAMGADNGAFYRYAVNLTDMGAEDILDGYATGIYPFWGSQGDTNRPLTVLTNKVYNFTGTWPIQVIVPVDMTDLFDTQPTQQQLLDACAEYETLHKPSGIPLSIRASRVRVEGDVAVDLGDTVRVVNTPWRIDIKTRIFALTFDALQGRVLDVQFGTVNPGFAGAVKNMK